MVPDLATIRVGGSQAFSVVNGTVVQFSLRAEDGSWSECVHVGDVSPADGRVSQIINAVPPRELGLSERPLPRISIFMSVFDCHINRSPVPGRIDRIVYKAGTFINADLDKASEDNERNSFIISTGATRIGVVQIAGLLARRIVCFTREGALVAAGERIGMIRFGSRVDVYLPEGVRPLVAEGQTSLAGETLLADLRGGGEMTFRVS